MSRPPQGHGYIDIVGPEEHFWRIETLWAAARDETARDTPLRDLPWPEDGCFVLGDSPTWGAFADHCKRAMEADLSYPVIVGPDGDVMDGMHRIVRAHVEGRASVPVVTLSVVPKPDRIRPLPPNGRHGEPDLS